MSSTAWLGDTHTHRAAAIYRRLAGRAEQLGIVLDGVWIQHMFAGSVELLITAFRDAEFGLMVGIGMGGAMTEIIDDVAFTRAPVDVDGAEDLLAGLRTLIRLPALLSPLQRHQAAGFLAGFSAVDALLVIDPR
jgi:hypothetical protein